MTKDGTLSCGGIRGLVRGSSLVRSPVKKFCNLQLVNLNCAQQQKVSSQTKLHHNVILPHNPHTLRHRHAQTYSRRPQSPRPTPPHDNSLLSSHTRSRWSDNESQGIGYCAGGG